MRTRASEAHAPMQFLGIDLAWADNPGSLANETGLVLLAGDGTVVDAGWSRGIQETLGWVSEHVHGSDVLAFVDAPLVVSNATGQRLCETQVGQRYGHWKVSANSTNLGSKNIAGVSLLELLEERGWIYDDGHEGPPGRGRTFSTRRCVPGPGRLAPAFDRELSGPGGTTWQWEWQCQSGHDHRPGHQGSKAVGPGSLTLAQDAGVP